MPQVINTNISSLNAQRNLNTSQSALATSLQRLSSGLRINSAKDDAAGLAISDRMTSQIRGLNQAARNANDGVSLAQTAEGGLAEVGSNLQRIRELAVQSANATNTSSDRASLNAEVVQLMAEIQRVATTSQFNGQNILDGTFTAAQFQVGANANQTITASTGNAQTSALGSYQVAATAVTGTALAAGGLYINDSAVGAAAGNAEAIATAINAVGNATGVTASAATSVTGSNALHKSIAISSGDLVINDINIGAIGGASTVAAQGSSIATAINLKTAQTGVSAIANATTGALTLSSSTGKNIAVTSGTALGASRVEAATGLEVTTSTAAVNTATFAGTVGVSTLTFTTTSGEADNFVLQGVTFAFNGGVAGKVDATHYNVGDATQNAAGDALLLRASMALALTNTDIKDVTIGAAAGAPVVITSTVGTSSTTRTNVTGTGVANLASSTLNVGAAGPAIGATISVGGQTFEFMTPGTTVTTAGNIAVQLGATGTATATNFATVLATQNAANLNYVTGSRGTNDVTLTSNKLGTEGLLEVNNNNATNNGTAGDITGIDFGTATGTVTDSAVGSTQSTSYGTLALNSAGTFSINGSQGTAAGLAAAGLGSGNVTLTAISTVDISTVAGANTAISLIDGALSQVATVRGSMGALQNRFSSVVSSLTASSENLAAARSRIQDADFAAETATLTRNQILQQAGIAMLAQANALPNQVLTLLRG
jgi:flagellin